MTQEERIAQARTNRAKAAALLHVARDARRYLQAGQESLGSARNWGIFDMLGGGMISTLVKHGKLDKAFAHIERAKPLLRHLAADLKEWSLDAEELEGLSGLAVFADFFFDGILADLYVQSKIRQFQEQLVQTIRTLEKTEDALQKLDAHEADFLRRAGMPS